MQAHTVYEALQLAISPVILISAYGLLLLSLTNRLGRAIDRARALILDSRANGTLQIAILTRRARLIRSAILALAIAILTAGLLVLVLFFSVFLPVDINLLVSVLFIISLLGLFAAVIYFIIDIYASLRAVEACLVGLRTADRPERPMIVDTL